MSKIDYSSFLASACGGVWKKVGAKRRAGVTTPLFSIYSAKSTGIGEIPDLKGLIDWCKTAGLSIIQLLPLNDVGFDFRPYDAQSSMALDPMYLSLTELSGRDPGLDEKEIRTLRGQFPAGKGCVNYGIKKAKLEFLRAVFDAMPDLKKNKKFQTYLKMHREWLEDYAVYKTLKDRFGNAGWMDWPREFKDKDPEAIEAFKKANAGTVLFYQWLQWQLFEQFSSVKKYAARNGVFLMGDMPFLVSRDSADVWARQDYFKLDLSSGAPSDLYFSQGQRWGMPPYHWERIASDGYMYVRRKMGYAENFFDLYRIDHFVGMFRLWTIRLDEPSEHAGLYGRFDPQDEPLWKEHGKKILDVMLESAAMLPCAEDLGVVPKCSYEILEEYKIPGSDVQRWVRNWGKDYRFKSGDAYRENSMAMLSTHDTSAFCAWWENEAGTVDEWFFRKKCEEKGVPFDAVKGRLFDLAHSKYGRLRWRDEIESVGMLLAIVERSGDEVWHLVDAYRSTYGERELYWEHVGMKGRPEKKVSPVFMRKALESVNQTRSIFTLQILQDWLSLAEFRGRDSWEYRINVPGTMEARNWSLVAPFSLEAMQKLPVNKMIRQIAVDSKRSVPLKPAK
ncbi:MAG TPA: 4-alpha-glucanotransferase [Candidatus Omnitrophota bacterium]|nr:4-alpha-glucanotransferase [Candidatus Omnitrophota bacterium]HPS37398.1 4-alpha-glucanotransferase [Candidatus Omnitrophota bacterium]